MTDRLREADARAQAFVDGVADELRARGERNHAKGGVCDFCDGELKPGHAVWVVDSTIVSSVSVLDADDLGTGTIVNVDDPGWAACETCDPIIAEVDPMKLAAHVLANGQSDVDVQPEIFPVIHAHLVELYTKFFESHPQRKDDR